ncbi:PP2C family protein-serine/threonine phosphatase [Jannaschia sp. CCS1]|uniref:PP2C family protein-serine/threonine phosphatase n=1 Tax=Jannaschia sp. (strain CCS1) TaxID=290400 RepID=UPI000053BD69|nr:protein phosphatase 2C domain-containing protein [Jannaschia sp. CCS1]ABD54523.1 protein serine/threonine phosphatase [Jannaschia sp. CCS1]
MSPAAPIGYDVATALWQGARPYQEDTLLADFHGGMDRGFAVLADGMGGHAAGDLASRLVVIDAVSHLKFLMHDGAALETSLVSELTSAIETANNVLKDRAAEDRRLRGMGATFLATVVFEDRLYWASVGDSPLYLWREGTLRQLNEDHSMAPVIDQMARAGEITPEQAASHPDRNALTSVLMGEPLKAMDVPKTATVLDPGDVLIQASDGLQYLDDKKISEVVARGGNSREIADALLAALRDLDDPVQDNTAILVLQLMDRVGEGAVSATAGSATAKSTVGSPSAPADVPSTATATGDTLSVGARRWALPAGLLAGAALVAGLVFGLPGGPPEPTSVAELETAGGTADAAPEADQAPAPALADAPVPATTAVSSATPTPDAVPEADVTQVHETIGETTALAEEGPEESVPAVVGLKPSQPAATEAARAANGATILFETTTPGTPAAPGANAVGLDVLRPQDAPPLPNQDAVEAQPESQRTRIPESPLPKSRPSATAKPTTSEDARNG